MDYCRTFVFKEIQRGSEVLFQWFREGSEEEEWIVPDRVLTAEEHWQLMSED